MLAFLIGVDTACVGYIIKHMGVVVEPRKDSFLAIDIGENTLHLIVRLIVSHWPMHYDIFKIVFEYGRGSTNKIEKEMNKLLEQTQYQVLDLFEYS